MSIWRLLKMLVSLVFLHRRHRKAMDQFRTSTLKMNSIDAVLAAYREGDYQGALSAAESMKGNPKLLGAYLFFTGTMLMHLGRLREAEHRLRLNVGAPQETKTLAIGYSSLGQLLLELQRYDEAMECFETSLRHWPDRGSSHRDIAETWLRRGNPSAAVEWAQRAVNEDRGRMDPEASAKLQEVCNLNLGEDLATLAWAVAADSRDRAKVENLAGEAVTLVHSAVSPRAMVHYHLGQAYRALGDSATSAEHFAEAARADPNGLWGRSARAMAA